MDALIDVTTRHILAVGSFPSGPPTAGQAIVTIAVPDWLEQPGEKVLSADGTVTVTPPAPDLVWEQRQQQEAADLATLRNYLASATPNPVLVALIRRVVG